MAVLSKSFEDWISWRSCNELVHPHSCRKAAFQNFFRFISSNSKYYLPLLLIHLGKHGFRSGAVDLDLLVESLWYYAQLVFGGVVEASLITWSICSLRNYLGKFHPSTLLFVPSALGGAFCAFFPKKVKHVQQTAIFQSVIENLMLLNHPLCRLLSTSVGLQAAIFMVCSAVILEGKQRKWYNGFWFLIPDPAPDKDTCDKKSCSHSESDCGLYIVRGIRNYLMYGLALDIFKALVSCTKSGQWDLKHFKLQSTAWLGCYVGIYRAVHCYLRRSPAIKDSLRHPLAGFLGGFSYLFYPKLTILSYALLEASRTLWAKRQGSEKKRYGYSDIIFPFAMAYLVQSYVMKEPTG
ncbi:transmembrane protein 135-like [Drosophila eugracilis]|uniref:transmembrane protein 135-like n=1 Tax=Drosophila eugracilis TaxID=29029 RepID=UPI001BD97B32|nr:transmembrane protein 135-like [Drosophila eugracilis]